MTSTDHIWLRGMAAQPDAFHLFSYGTAFAGTTAVQAVKLCVTAPRSWLAALARAAAAPAKRPAAARLALVPSPVAGPQGALIDAPVASVPHLLDGPRGGVGDDLTALKRVGPRLAQGLNGLGIYHLDQIASLDEDGIAWLDARQKGFRMICARHDLVAQARAVP